MASVEIINHEKIKTWLKPRAKETHKGQMGHVLVIGGELGYSGAPRMAGEAALRVGAGLVSIATHPENAFAMNADRPELMCHGVIHPDELMPLVDKANVIVLGPGLGQSAWSYDLWRTAIAQEKRMLVDADGLNLLAKKPRQCDSWVLTPHPGEAARLLNTTTQVIQQDRLAAAQEVVKCYGGVCVLKGAGTLIVSAHQSPVMCDKGNPGMASAGMGDILSGVIGGLMAQGIPLADAAQLGVYLHALAGDLAATDSGERGLIATDLLPYLHQLCNPKL